MSLRMILDRGVGAAEMAFFVAREKFQTGLVFKFSHNHPTASTLRMLKSLGRVSESQLPYRLPS